MATGFLVRKQVSPTPVSSTQDKYQNSQNQCNTERHTVATIVNRSTRLNIWVEIKGQPARALIDLGADEVYTIPVYTKR